MPFGHRPLLDFPIAPLKVLVDDGGHLFCSSPAATISALAGAPSRAQIVCLGPHGSTIERTGNTIKAGRNPFKRVAAVRRPNGGDRPERKAPRGGAVTETRPREGRDCTLQRSVPVVHRAAGPGSRLNVPVAVRRPSGRQGQTSWRCYSGSVSRRARRAISASRSRMTFASVRLRSTAFGPRKTAGHLMPGHRPVACSIFALTTRKPFCLRAAANSAALICGTGIGSLKRTIRPACRRRAADVSRPSVRW
jgi:hypothetical protein